MSVHLEEQQFIGPVTVFGCSEIQERMGESADEGEVHSVLHKNRLGYVFMHTQLLDYPELSQTNGVTLAEAALEKFLVTVKKIPCSRRI